MKGDFNSRCNRQDKLDYASVTNNPGLSGSPSSKGLLFAAAKLSLRVDCSRGSISSYHFRSGTQVGRAVTVWNVAGSMAERKESSRGFLTSATSWPQPAVLAHPTCVRQMGMGPENAVAGACSEILS